MNPLFTAVLMQVRFFVQLAALCVLYSFSLEKRDHFALRLTLGMTAGVLICLLLPDDYVFLFAGGMLLSAGMVALCRRVPIQDGLYCSACAYATQHFSYAAAEVLYREAGRSLPGPDVIDPILVMFDVAVYALFYLLFARHLAQGGRYRVDVKRSIASAVMLLAVVLVLSLAASDAYAQEGGERLYIICRCYAMFSCVFFLGIQVSLVKQSQLQEKLAFERQLSRQQREQYELSRETIDLINRKCHDLKHQVAALRTCVPEDQRERYLSELDRCVRIYDSNLKTGSEVLDTVLTEKSLYCEAHQIMCPLSMCVQTKN